MLTKDKILKQIESLTEEFTIDEFIESLIISEKIEVGLKQSKNDEVLSNSQLNEEIGKWFK